MGGVRKEPGWVGKVFTVRDIKSSSHPWSGRELAGGGWRWASEMRGSGTPEEKGQARKPVPQPLAWCFGVSTPGSRVGAAGTCFGKAAVLLPPSFEVVW